MTLSTVRRSVTERLTRFAWDEWAQVGVLAQASRESPWAADPEALLLFTLEVGRSDPRLFDEVLDWLAVSEALVSFQRFRNHYADGVDERLGESVVTWLAAQVRATRARPRPRAVSGSAVPLFYDARPPSEPDEHFLPYGFLRPTVRRTGKSRTPDTRRPINFAFRLRSGLGVSSRAEVMRFLLTAAVRGPSGSRPLFTTLAIADAAGFAKRNVQETLRGLAAAGWITQIVRGGENLYTLDAEQWHPIVWREDAPLPGYRDWTHALQGYAALHRWLNSPEVETLTPYMLGSEARRLVRQLAPSFGYAGLPASERDAREGAGYWDVFVDWVEQVLGSLESGLPW